MAEISESSSCSFAPPTLQQTLSLAGHLQEQITDLGARIRELQDSLGSTNDALGSIRVEVTRNAAAVNTNVSSHNEVLASLEALKGDFSRSTITLHRLRTSQEATRDDVAKLKDRHTGVVAQLSGLEEEFSRVDGFLHDLKVELNATTSSGKGIHEQHEKLERLSAVVERIRNDQDKSRTMARETCESLNIVVNDVHGLKESVSRVNNLTHVLDSRTVEQGASLKACRERVQQTASSLKPFMEAADSHSMSIQDLHGGFLENKARIDGLERLVEDSRGSLQTAQLRIERESAGLKTVKEGLDRVHGTISQSNETKEATATVIRGIQMRLHQAEGKMNEILDGIRDTNALVLPNVLQTGVGKDMNQNLLTKVGNYSPCQSARGQNSRLGLKLRSPWAPDRSAENTSLSPRPPASPGSQLAPSPSSAC